MNDNELNIILINRDIISNQTNEDNTPIIDLKKGDTVELKDDGIYISRRIYLDTFYTKESVFKNIICLNSNQ